MYKYLGGSFRVGSTGFFRTRPFGLLSGWTFVGRTLAFCRPSMSSGQIWIVRANGPPRTSTDLHYCKCSFKFILHVVSQGNEINTGSKHHLHMPIVLYRQSLKTCLINDNFFIFWVEITKLFYSK